MTLYIAFDTETTGLEPGSRLLELAAVAFTAVGDEVDCDDSNSGVIVDTFERLVHPGMPIPPDVTAIHHIADSCVSGSESATTVIQSFYDWIASHSKNAGGVEEVILIAHNAAYDTSLLAWECQRAGIPVPTWNIIDTRRISQSIGGVENHQLQTLLAHYQISVTGEAHRALPDADAVRQLFLTFQRMANTSTHAALSACQWPVRYMYTNALPFALHALPDWIAQGQTLQCNYTNAVGYSREWLIQPYGWAQAASGIVMHGYCPAIHGRRTFRIDRMENISVQQEMSDHI